MDVLLQECNFENHQPSKKLFAGTKFVPTVIQMVSKTAYCTYLQGYLIHDADLTLTLLNNTREHYRLVAKCHLQFSYNNLLLLLWDKSELQCAKKVISILYIFRSVITTLLCNYNQQMKLAVDFVMQQQHF